MRRITKFGSVAVALLIGVPAFLSLGFFDSAAASGPPLLYSEATFDPVSHLAYPDGPSSGGTHTYGYVLQEDGGDTVTIRERQAGGAGLYTWVGAGRVTALAADRDGTDYVFGTNEGQIVFVTSVDQVVDTEIIFETGSPVTSVDVEPGGNWYTAVTYHGDAYFFQRERLLDTGGFVWHHKAPLPAGSAPVNPDAYPDAVRDLEKEVLGDITFRPYSHVTFSGSANANNPTGLFVVALTAFGELWVFNAAQGIGPEGAAVLRPENHHLGDGACPRLPVPDMDLEVPCSRAATDRLLADLDALTGSAATAAFTALRQVMDELIILDPVYGAIPLGTDAPILDVAATLGSSSAGHHLIVAARSDGEIHGLQISRGTSTSPTDPPTGLRPLWRLEDLGGLTTMSLSNFIGQTSNGKARLVVGDSDGRLTSYLVSALAASTPTVDFSHEPNAGAIRAVHVVPGQVGDAHAGRYVTFATDTGNLALFDARTRTETGFPTEVWSGTAPVFGDAHDIAVTHTGSVLLATTGLSLYGGIPTVTIEAPSSVKKGAAFEAEAVVNAPDSTIMSHSWRLAPQGGGDAVQFSGTSIEHEFDTEGKYRLTLTIADHNGFEATAERTITVGGTPPIINMTAPTRAASLQTVTYDFNGTHDPDAAEGLGLDRIELFPYGNSTMVLVPLDTLRVNVTYEEIGDILVDATAYDLDGRSSTVEHLITVNDGGWCIAGDGSAEKECEDPDPPIGGDDPTDPGNETDGGDPGENETDDGNGTMPENAPPTASFTHHVAGFVLRVDGRTSSDPDGDPLTYRWHFGDGTQTSGATAEHAYSVAGVYQVHLVVEDDKGGRDVATTSIQIRLCGPATVSGATGALPYTQLTLAEASGHTVSFGAPGGDAGRFDVRSPSGALLYREPAGGPAIVSADVTADGCELYLGRADGTAVHVNVTDPTVRREVRLTEPEDEVAIRHTVVSDDGRHVLFATRTGQVILAGGGLTSWPGNHTIPSEANRIAADDHLYNVVVEGSDGRLHLLDGQGRKPDHLDTYEPAGTTTALEVTPNLDPFGRGWLFIGRADGRLVTIKLQSHRFHVASDVAIQAGVPVLSLSATPLDREAHYRLGIVTSAATNTCKAETESPCGRLSLIDSRGPFDDNVLVPRKKLELQRAPQGFVMNHEARHFLLTQPSRSAVDRYDTVWDAPQQTMSGFTGTIRTLTMADTNNAYGLLDDGRLVWFYAPPTADFRAGSHDDSGSPLWGERITAKRPTTFDASPSRPGVGSIVGYRWDFGDGTTSSEPMPQHTYATQGRYLVKLTITSRVSGTAESLLFDRYHVSLTVWDPPPIARLTASPFDTTLGAVNITSGESVRFDASASFDPHGGRIIHYLYRFGDGGSTSGTKTPTHVYQRGGVFWATVTVTDDQGFSTKSDPIRVVVANRAPSAMFGWDQPERNESQGWVTYGVPVLFDGTLSTDPDGRVTGFEWTFPGGVTKTDAQVWHTFGTPGTPSVSLRVRDDAGAWSDPISVQMTVDDGIRLRHTQDPSSGRTINPTEKVTATGFVHDFNGYPEFGNGIPNVRVHVEVYYDGALGSAPAAEPYETKTRVTNAQGEIIHSVAYNQGVAFKPGKYRIQLTAEMTGSLNGDTEYSQTTETHFVVT